VLQNRMHPIQQKFFDFEFSRQILGTHISMPIILYYHCNVGLEARPNIVRFPISLFHISF
jgi:hypothetical protein